jgi:D-inositol-3-phosphate glycosyltransferase
MRGQDTLGIVLPQRLENATVYGANVAADDFVDALCEHSKFNLIRLVHAEHDAEHLAEALASAARFRSATQVDALSWRSLAASAGRASFDVWHDVRPRGDCRRAMRIRDLSRRPYPVTLTHHALNYSSYLHSFFLPVLLSDSRSCDAIVCASAASRAALTRILDLVASRFEESFGAKLSFRGQTPVLPLGVDTERFRPRDQGDARRQLRLPPNALLLLWLGRVSASDKADLLPLLRVLARLVQANPAKPLLLVIAGAGSARYETSLVETAAQLGVSEHVRFERAVLPQSRHTWYNAADVFVSPADNVQETFGLTPLEAMASGIPQVVSDWDGYRDTVVQGATGFLVPTCSTARNDALDLEAELLGDSPETHLKLAQTVALDLEVMQIHLQQLIDEPELRQTMGMTSRSRAASHFDWRHVVRGHEELWSELRSIAASETSRSGPPPYMRPSYHEVFASYPTRMLDAKTEVRLTADGRAILGEGDLLPHFGLSSPFLQRGILRAISQSCGASPTNGSCSTGKICKQVCDMLGCDESVVEQHVIWVAKHGFVCLSSCVWSG